MEGLKPIHKTEESISYLGVEIPRAEDRSGAVSPEKYADFIDDPFTLEFQKKLAISIKNGDPVLIEGGTSIGKTTAVRKMCAELGYEVHYVNLNGATDVEDLMGRYVPNAHREKLGDSEYIFSDGKVTSGLRQETGKIKVVLLDEFNSASPNIVIRLHEVLDALERGGQVTLSEDASEIIDVDKTKTKVIGLMNPPGGEFIQREPLDPAQLRRWVYQKEANSLPENVLGNRTKSLFGIKKGEELPIPEALFLPSRRETLSIEALAEIPGLEEILAKYDEFHGQAKKLIAERKIAKDQPQSFTFDDNEERRRVRDFVLNFYQGDITKTIQDALRYYYSGKIMDENDKAKINELIKLVEYSPKPADSRRKDPSVAKSSAPTPPVSKEASSDDFIKDAERRLAKALSSKEGVSSQIDTEKPPKLPSWAKEVIENDTSLGTIEWSKEVYKDSLFLSPEQIAKKSIKGEKLLESIKKEKIPVLNASVLDYLLEHKDEIPEEWKEKMPDGRTKYIYFWGTIFRGSDGDRLVRSLDWDGSDWDDDGSWLGHDWADNEPAVRLAS
jgi:MoxR-like ATPase